MGRPKSDKPLPTATQRASKSIDSLVAAGGRRFNLRLSKEGNSALKTIMQTGEYPDETAAINQTLIARANHIIKKK